MEGIFEVEGDGFYIHVPRLDFAKVEDVVDEDEEECCGLLDAA